MTTDKGFRITYEVVTEESAAEGDVAESGWENEEGESCLPDKWDLEEGVTAVMKAIDLLNDRGATEYSVAPASAPFSDHDWWTTEPAQDFRTGEETSYGLHPYGFTPGELEAIYNGWKTS